jgi:histidinol-phosphate aminotransferase
MEFNLDSLVRDNVKKMTAYSSARHEFTGNASIYLDANENSFGSPLPDNFNRYPDPLQMQVKEKLSKIKGVPSKIFSLAMEDEAIDLFVPHLL